MLLAMSEHHSGNAEEALRIVDAQLAALEAAELLALVEASTGKPMLIDNDERTTVRIFTPYAQT